MTKSEFKEEIKQILKSNGFIKISISTALIGRKADITARDSKGEKCRLKGFVKNKRGKKCVIVKSEDDWLDELIMLDAIFDD